MGLSKITMKNGDTIYMAFLMLGNYGISIDVRWPIQTTMYISFSLFPINLALMVSFFSIQIGYMGVLSDEV